MIAEQLRQSIDGENKSKKRKVRSKFNKTILKLYSPNPITPDTLLLYPFSNSNKSLANFVREASVNRGRNLLK
jgi:hypothetical protein